VTEQRPWAIQLTVLASDAELGSIIDRIGAAICSPSDHPGPCVNPWSVTSAPVDDLEDDQRSAWMLSLDELREQRHSE